MLLVHTLLFFIRESRYEEDMRMADLCLRSLSRSAYKTVVIYNQGCLSNDELKRLVSRYDLSCVLIGGGMNIGIVLARQTCFDYVWKNFPWAEYVSELHLDMIFSPRWEDSLIEYLRGNDEPVISCGIIDNGGYCHGLPEPPHALPNRAEDWDAFLTGLKRDVVIPGFTHPCIHDLHTLREVGGYHVGYLRGNQCFEDDSLLLSYYLYYGARADWKPKIDFNSVVYHSVAAQRLELDDGLCNYIGLIQQYGVMGLGYLARLHSNPGQKCFFEKQYIFLKKDVYEKTSG